jgi:CelD/BcsL family acetyltransferase involved in cellulose biosynthesis
MHVAASREDSTSMPTAAGERIAVARTIDEVEALRALWAQLPVENMDADIDHFLTVVRHRREVLRPHVIHIQRPDAGDLLVVARLEDFRLEATIGYRAVARPRVRALFVAFDGIVGAATEADYASALAALQQPLREGEADVIVLPKLPLDGPLARAARAAAGRLRLDLSEDPVGHWTLATPSYAEFLAARASKTRRNIKYYRNRAEREHPDLEVTRYEDVADVDEIAALMEQVAVKTYQHGLGAGFGSSELDRPLLELGLRQGWVKVWVMRIDGAPAAFWHGIGYRGTFHADFTGYDPAYSGVRVGNVLAAQMIQEVADDPAITRLDWGHGDAEYKRIYGDDRSEEANVLIYAPTLRAVRIGLVHRAITRAASTAKRLAERSDRARKLKNAWRRRLSAGS